ncbi:MAG: hypothetical protein WA417_14845 [Stellaceae bacterium]
MLPHDTSAKGRPSREVREERARAFWQAQINEGRARAAEQQAKTTKPAAPPQDPPSSPPPPARVPLHVVSADTEFTDTTPPINPADIPALFLAATSVLRLINAGTSDGRRFSAAPQAKDRAAWRLVQTAVPSLTDKAAQAVINSWLHTKVLETRSYRDPLDRRHYPGLFVTPFEEPAEVS